MSSRPGGEPFWLCHECGAQMRPLRIDGVPHCASCNSDFLEILDDQVNPDPFHELPHPPVRPGQSPPPIPHDTRPPDTPDQHNAHPGFMQSLFGSLFGAAQEEPHPNSPPSSSHPPSGSTSTQNNNGGTRTYNFNIGGGRGSVTFGTFGSSSGPQTLGSDGVFVPGFGPFGSAGFNQGQVAGLDPFFQSAFNPPRANTPGQQGQQGQGHPQEMLQGPDLLRALMSALMTDGDMPPNVHFIGPQGRANMGDYVMTENGFNQVLEQLMQAAGPQGPLPASDTVIEGLPRFTFDEKSLEQSPFKDCPVCKDDFAVGEEYMRIPCTHIFHVDCIQPWLRVNGSCPVCRFSLVPDEANRQAEAHNPPQSHQHSPESPNTDSQGGVQGALTNMLNRLWGQSGAGGDSNPTSPAATGTASNPLSPQTSSLNVPTQSNQAPTVPDPATPHATSPPLVPSEVPGSGLSSAIPDDYRARHRAREQQQHQQQQQHQNQQQNRTENDDLDLDDLD